jgi:uncharacterized membrane protein
MGKKSFWLIFFVGLLVRLIASDQSFWLDEAASLTFSGLSLGDLFVALKGDFHPPLFYLLLHYWLLATRSLGEVWIRFPFILIGSLTVPVLYLFLLELLGPQKKKVALMAALLLLFNPLHIYYSIELRMYSLSALLSLLSWQFLDKWMKKINHRPYAICYLLFTVANLYTFYGAFFNLASQWLYLLWHHKNKFKPFVICNLVVGIFFLPWTSSFISQLAGGGYLVKVLPGWSQLSGNLSPKSLGLIMAKFTLGRVSLVNKGAYTIFVAGISLYFLLCSHLASSTRKGRALLFWFYGSLFLAVLVSLRAPVLGYWRYIYLIPPFVAIIALGLSNLPGRAYKLNLLVVLLVFALGNLTFWTSPVFQREDWRSAAKLISEDNSLTILNFPGVFDPLKFYAPGVYYYPDQESLGKIRSDLDQTLPLVLKDKQTVFVLDYLSDLTDRKRSILTWLVRAGLKQESTHNINGVGFIYEFSTP